MTVEKTEAVGIPSRTLNHSGEPWSKSSKMTNFDVGAGAGGAFDFLAIRLLCLLVGLVIGKLFHRGIE